MKLENWQAEEFGRAVSRLAANLLRVMAGAGRVIDLERQFDETNKLAKQVCEQEQGWPLSERVMNQALTIPWSYSEAKTDNAREFNEEQHLTSSIVRYSLRLAAAKIENNNGEASKNESLLHQSIRNYEDARRARNDERNRIMRVKR